MTTSWTAVTATTGCGVGDGDDMPSSGGDGRDNLNGGDGDDTLNPGDNDYEWHRIEAFGRRRCRRRTAWTASAGYQDPLLRHTRSRDRRRRLKSISPTAQRSIRRSSPKVPTSSLTSSTPWTVLGFGIRMHGTRRRHWRPGARQPANGWQRSGADNLAWGRSTSADPCTVRLSVLGLPSTGVHGEPFHRGHSLGRRPCRRGRHSWRRFREGLGLERMPMCSLAIGGDNDEAFTGGATRRRQPWTAAVVMTRLRFNRGGAGDVEVDL